MVISGKSKTKYAYAEGNMYRRHGMKDSGHVVGKN